MLSADMWTPPKKALSSDDTNHYSYEKGSCLSNIDKCFPEMAPPLPSCKPPPLPCKPLIL